MMNTLSYQCLKSKCRIELLMPFVHGILVLSAFLPWRFFKIKKKKFGLFYCHFPVTNEHYSLLGASCFNDFNSKLAVSAFVPGSFFKIKFGLFSFLFPVTKELFSLLGASVLMISCPILTYVRYSWGIYDLSGIWSQLTISCVHYCF